MQYFHQVPLANDVLIIPIVFLNRAVWCSNDATADSNPSVVFFHSVGFLTTLVYRSSHPGCCDLCSMLAGGYVTSGV